MSAQTGSPFRTLNLDEPAEKNVPVSPFRTSDATGGSAAWTGTSTAGDSKGVSAQALTIGDSIAVTGYDFQTNGTMAERIINWGKNGAQPEGIQSTLIYMAATTLHPNTPDRGTYGAVLTEGVEGEGTWLPINLSSWVRIEEARSGFPDVDYFPSGDLKGHLVIVSHTNDNSGINVMLEVGSPGSGEFFTFVIPGSERGFWPKVAIDDSSHIHVIWTYQNVDESGQPDPKANFLSYARSTDLGQSWGNIADIGGAGQDLPGTSGGDAYTIDAEGPHVAIWYYTTDVRLLQVTNPSAGLFNAWVPSVVSSVRYRNTYTTHSGDSVFHDDSDHYGPDTTGFVSDTVPTHNGYFDMMVQEDGSVIGAFGQYNSFMRRFLLVGEDTTAWSRRASLIVPDNSTVPLDRAFKFVHLLADGTPITTSLVPLPEGVDNSAEFFGPRGFGEILARWPQFGMNGNGDIFMIYGSGKAGDVVTGTPEGQTEERTFYRSHTYSVVSNNGGSSWSAPKDLTPVGVDAQFGTLADWVDHEAHIALQTDTYPGDYLTSSDSNGFKLHPAVFSSIEVMILPADALSGVDDNVLNTASVGVAISNVSPNPVSSHMELTYSVARSGQTSITIVDALGRTVGTLLDGNRIKGEYRISTDLSDLPSGAYHIVIANGEGTSTAPLHIVR